MYEAKQDKCRKDGGPYKIASVTQISGCTDIANALQGRPIAVRVATNNWDEYKSGIWKHCSTRIDYQVLLVGMTDSYWKIKNSWGTSWG